MITKLVETDDFVLGLEHNGILMSPEEFDEIRDYDECFSYELVNGVLIVNPVPLAEETGPNEYLGYLLIKYREEHPEGKALTYTLPEQYIRTSNGRRRADR